MPDISKLTIDLDGIGHTISDNKLTVPPYQRSYAWEEAHVIDLIDDILTSIRNSEDEYFIGSIVISSGVDRDEVVDGQQRLATVSILIAAIRDYFLQTEDKNRADDIQNKYLSSRDLRTQEVIPNLVLNNNDNNFFYKKVIVRPSEGADPIRASHDRILKAIDVAGRKIEAYVSSDNKPAESLIDLCEFLDEHLKVIVVRVPNHANAFTIFETLNDRGLDLAISDLLKNFLLGHAENRLQEVQENWTRMYSMLENTENEDLVVTFLRQYWSAQYGLTRERDLYKKIKEKITSKQRAIDFSTNLEEAAKIYVALIDTKNGFWSTYTEEAKLHMATLNLFGMTQMRPLLLAVFLKFEKKEIEATLKFLVSASVRLLIHGGLGGGALESQFSERAKEISVSEITKTKELIAKLSKVVPTDTQFIESFKSATVSKQYLARYYLRSLEKTKNGDASPELIPNTDTAVVNLEHVMPQNPNASWTINPETHRAYVNRLGNLAIMNSKLNSIQGSDSFEKKKALYTDSPFKLTAELATYAEWDETTINKRQEKLAELAAITWKL